MLKKVRISLAVISFLAITLLFVDISGTATRYLGWLAKVQFLPALFALNVGVLVALILLTLLMGRIYCSVICPMGVFQDVISRLRTRRNRFGYKPAARWTRLTILGVFVVCIVVGLNVVVSLLAPYSAYGRMVTAIVQPLWIWCNNLLASWAESNDSYMFSAHQLWLRSVPVLIVAVATMAVVGVTAWRSGRGYCNTICPVGTLLGFLSKWAIFRPVIDVKRCNSCGLCAKNCKSHCINPKDHSVDMTRCVVCFDCVSRCRQGAISYRPIWKKSQAEESSTVDKVDNEGRRAFLTITGIAATSALLSASKKKVDGGLAVIEDRTPPSRSTRLVPAGSISHKNMNSRCTGCQLCVSKCPNNVLRPSTSLTEMMQPTMEFDHGYCRPGCTLCSRVCPTGAIKPITRQEKTSISIGYAVVIEKNCVVATDGVECGNCQRHCPTGAIIMVESKRYDGRKIPSVNTDKCIGCGACEYLCPARPLGAIYVEGRQVHTSR